MEADHAALLDAEGDGMDPVRREMLDVFAGFLLELSDMKPNTLAAIFGLLANRPLAAIAADTGTTFQNIGLLQKNALRKMPVLRSLIRRVRAPRPGKAQSNRPPAPATGPWAATHRGDLPANGFSLVRR